MRVLWVNPSFLDYRVPLYEELNKLFNGSFHLIYSIQRIPERCNKKIIRVLGKNAHGLEYEKQIVIGKSTDFSNSYISIPYPKGLYKQIKAVRPDFIIAEGYFQFTPWALWYSFIHRIPLMIAYERTAHTERNCPLWRRLYRKFVGMFVTGYIANGQLTKEYLISQGVKSDKIFTGGMCADSEGLAKQVSCLSDKDKESIRKELLSCKTCVISYVVVGQIIPRKGVNYLIEGFVEHSQKHQQDRLLVVGDGPDLPYLREKYENNQNVLFVGGIDYSQIYKYYAACDVFVIATLEDNWSLVVPEAMACGLPVACSIYNGCHPELVHKDENGITFDPLIKQSIVDTLDYFHHVDIAKMGKRSVEIEHNYNPENTAINIMEAVNSLSKKSM